MAELSQRVKYIVEVDSSALATLRTEISTGIIALETWEKGMRAAVEASKKAESAFARVTSKMQANTLASARADLELKDLIKSQDAAGTASVNLANQVAGLNTAFREMKSAGAQAKNAVENVQKASTAASSAAKSAEEATGKAGMTFLRAFGKFQAAKWIVSEVFDSIKSGAQQLDLERILGQQIGRYTEILEEAKTRTAGVVSEGALRKSMALMSSFGIPMERFAESMELVQKMAIRTGQSSEFLTDSFGRAISRLSPLILDNLGIQVSLKDANEAYAASVGKSSDGLTKYEQKIGFMNMALEKMKANTEGVTFGGAGATVSRAEATLKNWVGEAEKLAAKGVWAWDVLGQGTRASAEDVLAYRIELGAASKLSDKFYADTQKYNPEKFAQFTREAEAQKDALLVLAQVAKDPALEALYSGSNAVFTRSSIEMAAGQGVAYYRGLFDQFKRDKPWLGDWTDMWEDWRTLGAGAMLTTFSTIHEQAQPGFDKLKQQFAGLLSEDQLTLMWGDYIKSADKVGADIVKRARAAAEDTAKASGGDVNNYFFQNLMRMGQQSGLLDSMNVKMQAQAVVLAINSAISKDLNDKLIARVGLYDLESAHHDKMRQLSDGSTLAQVKYNEAKAHEQEIQQEIQKLVEARNEALAKGGETAELQRQLEVLAVQRDQAATSREMWSSAVASQEVYFNSFKNKSKAAIQAEIERQKILLDQTKLRMLELHALSLISGQMLGADKSVMNMLAEQAKDLDSKIVRLEKGLSRGGGGSDRKKDDGIKGRKNLEGPVEGPDWIRQWKDDVDQVRAIRGDLLKFDAGMFTDSTNPIMNTEQFKEYRELVDKLNEMREKGLDKWGEKLFGDLFKGVEAQNMALINEELATMEAHFRKITEMADGMHRFADGLQSAFAGMEGLVGGEYVAMMGDLVQGFEGLSQAIGENANAYGMMNAVAPIMRAFTHNLIKDRKAQAGIEMLMQGAAAWAAAATGNIPAAVAHGISAAMYGGIAGGLIKLPKGKASEDKPGADRNGKAAPRPDIHIYITGPLATTEAERGLMIRDALQAASRQGL